MSKMIQLRHVPEAVHRRLKARAALDGLSLSDFLIREVTKIAERPSPSEVLARLQALPAAHLNTSPTHALRAERDSR